MSWSVKALLVWLSMASISVYAFEIGETVVVIQDADLTAESGAVEKVFPGRCMKIVAAEGSKLSVKSRGRIGWLPNEHIVPLEDAVAALTELIQQHPREARYVCGRGLVWNEKQESDKAIADFTEAIRLDSKDVNVNAYIGRGAAWNAKKQYETAIADYSDAIQLDSKNVLAYLGRGKAWQNNKDQDKAITDYTSAIRIDPNFAAAYDQRAAAWYAKQQYDKVIADCDESIRIDPQDDWAYNLRGWSWNNSKEYDKAIADFTEAIRINAKFYGAFNGRGLAWDNKSDCDKAIADFTEAIKIDPKSAAPYRDRGWAREGKRETEKAIVDYTEAIKIDPQVAYFYYLRGNVYIDQTEYDRAIDDYSQAIRINPRFARAYLHRGYAKFRNGDQVNSVFDTDQANQIDGTQSDPRMYLDANGKPNLAVIIPPGKMGRASVRLGRTPVAPTNLAPQSSNPNPIVRGLERVWTKEGGNGNHLGVALSGDGKTIITLDGKYGESQTAEFIDLAGTPIKSLKLPVQDDRDVTWPAQKVIKFVRSARLTGKEPGELLLIDDSRKPLNAIDLDGKRLWSGPASDAINDICVVDLDRDGRDEVIVGYNGGSGVNVYGSDGKLRWNNKSVGNVWHVTAGDLDGDGLPEIITASGSGRNPGSGKIHIFKSNGQKLTILDPKIYASWVRVFRLSNAKSDSIITMDIGNSRDSRTAGNVKIVAVNGKGEQLWQTETKGTDHCHSLAVAASVPWIAAAFSRGQVLVIDASSGKNIAELPSRESLIQVAWSTAETEPLLLVAAPHNQLTAWRVKPETADSP